MSTDDSSHQNEITAWRNVQNSSWLNFSNNLFKIKESGEDEAKDKKERKKKNSTAFFFNPRKYDLKGCIVYTPKGYGILQESLAGSSKLLAKEISVKVNNKITSFSTMELLYDIPIKLKIFIDNSSSEDYLSVPTNSSVQDLLEKIDVSLSSGQAFSTTKVYFNGKEIRSSSETLEKSGIHPESTLVVTSSKNKKPLIINRFGIVYEGWGFYNYTDGISFSCNKSVKIVGFGVYRPSSGDATYSTTAKFLDGTSSTNGILFEKEVTVVKNNDDLEDKVQKIFFDKPIKIKEGQIMTCMVKTGKGNAYYGDQGKNEISQENGVTFTFVTFQESYNSGGTDTNCGHVPEIYYFL